jgi:hypothetical protein
MYACAFCRVVMPTVGARQRHEQDCDVASTEKLCWYACKDRMPDDGDTVLMFGSAFDEVREGFLEAGCWHLPDGVPIEGDVSHWAPMPMGPIDDTNFDDGLTDEDAR